MEAVRSLLRRAIWPVSVACVLGVPVAVGGSEPIWRNLAAAPAPRQEVSYVALGDNLYLAAGNDRSQQRYDPETDQWEPVEELPASFEGIDHVHAVAVGGRIVYIGGLSSWELPFPVTGTVAIYDPGVDEFTTGSEMPSPRAAGGVAVWQGKVIYAGGLGPNGAVARVDAYDPLTDQWTQLADMPRARDHFQAAVVGDHLYAIGGRDTFDSGGQVDTEEIVPVDVLDLPSDASELTSATWRAGVTSIPTPRGGHGVIAVGSCIYAIGGESAAGESEGVIGITESYDTATGTWGELSSLWTPRHGIQAAAIGETIYVAAGGVKAFAHDPTAAHEALDVSGDAPCVDEGVGDPAADPPSEGSASASTRPLRIDHLAVKPRRVRLRSGHPRQRGAEIVLSLSRPGRVSLSLPQHFRFSRRLHAGRNLLPLPRRSGGRLLPRGRYRLRASPLTPGENGRVVRASFRVVD